MEIQKNMSVVMQAIKRERNKSLVDFAEELEVASSSLQEYLTGRGNPRMTTIEHLAQKLNVDVTFLISGAFSDSEIEVLLKLLDTLGLLSGLPVPKRRKFAQLLLEMVSLWDEEK